MTSRAGRWLRVPKPDRRARDGGRARERKRDLRADEFACVSPDLEGPSTGHSATDHPVRRGGWRGTWPPARGPSDLRDILGCVKRLFRWVDGLERGQRVVLVIAAGVAVAALASGTNGLVLDREPDGGWFAYAPNTGVEFSPERAADTWRTFVWVAAASIWGAFSVRVLSARRPPEDE